MRLARYDRVNPTKEQRRAFDCGERTLDRWLATQARQSMETRDAATYLLLDDDEGSRIAGYYCLSAGEISREAAPPGVAKRAPAPIPVILMGRFAIDRRYQKQGWGADLLREALGSAVEATQLIGGRALLADAINASAKSFYLRFGFERSPIHPMQLLYDLRTVALSALDETPLDETRPP